MTNMEHVTDITIALLENIGDQMYWALKKDSWTDVYCHITTIKIDSITAINIELCSTTKNCP